MIVYIIYKYYTIYYDYRHIIAFLFCFVMIVDVIDWYIDYIDVIVDLSCMVIVLVGRLFYLRHDSIHT